jgi:hypothetical protein
LKLHYCRIANYSNALWSGGADSWITTGGDSVT